MQRLGASSLGLWIVLGGTGCGDIDRQPRQPNEPPIALLSVPAEGRVGDRLLFDAAGSSDVDGELVEFRFQPGVGLETLIVSEPRLSYEYAEAGTYTVVLTVVDDRGASATALGETLVRP